MVTNLKTTSKAIMELNKSDKWVQSKFSAEIFTFGFHKLESEFANFNNLIKEKKIKVTTIAGTNGKGECAHALSNCLLQCKKNHDTVSEINVALWTSPHIHSVRERFVFNGEMVDDDFLLERMIDVERELEAKNVQFSYFEFLFYVFTSIVTDSYFGIKHFTHLVLEVGLGGRLDATNVFDADLSIITSIARDHEDILGRGYRNIIREKLGIVRNNRPLITSLNLQFLKDRVVHYFNEHSFALKFWQDCYDANLTYSQRNQLLAHEACKKLFNNSNLSFSYKTDGDFRDGLKSIAFEKIVFDFNGAHNLDGMREFCRRITQLHVSNRCSGPYDLVIASFSKRSDIEVIAMIDRLKSISSRIVIVSFDHFKAHKNLKSIADKLQIPYFDNYNSMLGFLIHMQHSLTDNNGQRFLVTGSYYFVGGCKEFLNTHMRVLE